MHSVRLLSLRKRIVHTGITLIAGSTHDDYFVYSTDIQIVRGRYFTRLRKKDWRRLQKVGHRPVNILLG